jgi:hypothetical protein
LRGRVLDVAIIPADDDVTWNEGPPGSFGGMVGNGLRDIALVGGFTWNVYVVSPPDEAYRHSWDTCDTGGIRTYAAISLET